METIKKILPGVIHTLQKPNLGDLRDIEDFWKGFERGEYFSHIAIKSFRSGTLSIQVDTPARKYQLNFKRAEIVKELLNKGIIVKQIVLKIGKVS